MTTATEKKEKDFKPLDPMAGPVEPEVQELRARMAPRKAPPVPNMDDYEAVEEVEEDIPVSGIPVIIGAKVVYMGHLRNKTVPMLGRLMSEPILNDEDVQISEVKTAVEETGIQSYDFSTHDNRGRMIKTHRMPSDLDTEVANRRYCVVEHAEHLRQFQRRVDQTGAREFRVFVPKRYRAIYDEYRFRKERRETQGKHLLSQTMQPE